MGLFGEPNAEPADSLLGQLKIVDPEEQQEPVA